METTDWLPFKFAPKIFYDQKNLYHSKNLIEFQQRGTLYCHILIWLEDFPDLNTPEGVEAMEDLCKCEIPENDPELAELVRKYQIHRNSKKTCYKNGKQTCRFNFPRAACKETKILDINSS